MNTLRLLAVSLLLFLVQTASALPLWELEGTRGQIQLLGSIHFLRASDYPLPAAMEQAYEDADVLIMELDMDNMDVLAAQAVIAKMAIDPEGRDLEAIIGTRDFNRARNGAAKINVELDALRAFEPWFAALQVTQMRLLQLGLDPNLGLEQQWSSRAQSDGKEVRGLETLEEQLTAMDSMSPEVQRSFLLRTIDEAVTAEDMINATLDAWRNGDLERLERETTRALEDQPELYRKLLVDRNRAWTGQIRQLAREDGNFLIVVGSAHLLGKDSVLNMLDAEGLPSRRIAR